MAGFGSGNSTDNLGNEAVNDAKKAMSAASTGYKAYQQGKKDAKAVAKAAGQLASGNVAGAAKTAIENPMTALKVLLVGIVILSIPLMAIVGCAVFVLSLPGNIAEATQSAIGQSVDSVVLGWEDYKARLSNSVDDFLTLITTGKSGTKMEAYKDDLAIANDDVFTGYIGTSNVIVAVLNNYFRDEYEAFDAKARVAANNRLEQLQQRATNEGIASSDVTYSVDPEIYEGKNYLNWTFYIIAGDSYTARNEEGIHFRVKEMIDAAKGLEKSNLWKVTLKSTYTTEKKTRMVTHSGTRDKEVPVTDENGNQLYDAKGNPRTTIIKEPYSETVPEEYTAANITVSYKYSPKEGAKQYILDRFGITNDKANDKDISDEELFDEQVAQLRELYHAREAEFDYNSDLVIDENYPENGATGTVVTSPAIRTLIQQFYATHSADSLFVAPSPVGGPWSGWKSRVNSPLGQIRNGVAHNGTDILVPSVQYSLIAPSQGIIVGIQDGYANGALQTSGQASRGNFVFVYYGEQGSVGGQKGVFVLYQHLTPGITWHVGDTIPAGAVIGRTGWSGYCVSSHGGTGEHLHLEQYIGFEQVDPESYLGN